MESVEDLFEEAAAGFCCQLCGGQIVAESMPFMDDEFDEEELLDFFNPGIGSQNLRFPHWSKFMPKTAGLRPPPSELYGDFFCVKCGVVYRFVRIRKGDCDV